jgi:hypothetical protein
MTMKDFRLIPMKSTVTERLVYLRDRYGEILTLEEVAEVFRFKTVAAARKAHERKTLPVALYRFKGRSGYFARAPEVAESLENMDLS